MTLDELIERLIEIKTRYAAGDLMVVCQNGMDPSDWEPVMSADLDDAGNVRIEV